MQRIYYFLIELKGTWWVDCSGKQLGPYDNRALAVEKARKVLTLFVDSKEQVSLIGADENGKMATLWKS